MAIYWSLIAEDFTIRPLLTGCCRNDRGSQKQLFLLLQEFALKISYRYTSISQDPMTCVYEGFLKLYQGISSFPIHLKSDLTSPFKKWFKTMLIDTCIELGRQENDFSFGDHHSRVSDQGETFHPLSNKQLIDMLRMLPFAYRMVYNLSIIDAFEAEEISSKLKISTEQVDSNLQQSRELLRRMIIPLQINESV